MQFHVQQTKRNSNNANFQSSFFAVLHNEYLLTVSVIIMDTAKNYISISLVFHPLSLLSIFSIIVLSSKLVAIIISYISVRLFTSYAYFCYCALSFLIWGEQYSKDAIEKKAKIERK